ncbi:hypothetical protein E4656_00350 [Natronospirillum operosum]|uniref:Uncharacterized protein n=1 Tax=Natronospirillum operosum TaxID=2759953 RepID=A0A4Z0WG34_9GAMM|nr:hypothetical protein [Natronospirillum operosum]TGG94917.1 hypothetical protein E4656_00350 [Natronospirillum operosum]
MDFIITVSLVALATLLLGVMAWMHVRYRKMVADREKILQMGTENKKLQAMLRSLPENYLSPGLKDFIYRTLINNLQQMMELDRSHNRFLQVDLDETIEQRQVAQANPVSDDQHEPITNIEQANHARAGLKALYRYIKIAYESRHLSRQEAQALLNEIEHKLVQTGAEFYTHKAEHAHRQRRYREAIALWNKAAETYTKSRLASQYQKKANHARGQARKLQEEWKEVNRARNEAQAEAMQKKMDAWMEDEESWKKKQLYDE